MAKKLLSIKTFFWLTFLSSTVSFGQNALHFFNTGNYVQTNYAGISGNNAITVEALIKTGGANNEQIITTWGSESYNGGRFTFRVNAVGSTDVIRIENKGGGINGTINVNDGNWHHVAVTYDPTISTNKYKLFVDGVLDTQGNISTVLNVGTDTNVIIGRRINPSFGGFFDGPIDEVRIWNIALTQVQISEYKNVSVCAQPNLMVYFKMDEGVAGANNTTITQITDSSGNGYFGTLNGFNLTGTTSNFITNAVSTIQFNTAVTSSNNTLTVAETSPTATFQWVDCDNSNAPISNETNASFTPSTAGNYAVIITKSGCSETSSCQQITLSSENFELTNQIKLYPNPANGFINLSFGRILENVNLTVTNLTGQVILEQKHQNTSELHLDLNASNGVYFVNLLINNEVTKTFKIINK